MNHQYAVQTEAGGVTLNLSSGTSAAVSQKGAIYGRLHLVREGWVPDKFDVFVPGTSECVTPITRSIVMKAVLRALDQWAVLNQDKLAMAEINACEMRLEMLGKEQWEERNLLLSRRAKCIRAVGHGRCCRN